MQVPNFMYKRLLTKKKNLQQFIITNSMTNNTKTIQSGLRRIFLPKY